MDIQTGDRPIVSLLYLDDFHLGDPLFLQALGRSLARRQAGRRRPILVHGPGEYAQRRLEAEGIFLRMQHGVYQTDSEDERHLVLVALRDVNRWLVGLLTEAVVPAVGFMGSDRSLLLCEEGRVAVGRSAWLESVLRQQAVPVLAAATRSADGADEQVDPVSVVEAFAAHFDPDVEVVMFTTNSLSGVMIGRDPVAEMALDDVLQRDVLADPRGAETLVLSGARVLITNTVRYAGDGDARGTWIAGKGL